MSILYKARSSKLEMNLLDNPFAVDGFFCPKSAKVCAKGTQSFFIRTADNLFDPYFLSKVHKIESDGNKINFTISDEDSGYFLHCSITPEKHGLKYSIEAEAPENIWMVEWRMSGFDFKQVLSPALGGQAIMKSLPEGITVNYKYPFWWNAQFLLGEMEGGCLMLSPKDPNPELKVARVSHEDKRFSLGYGVEMKAPLNSKRIKAEWHLEFIEGDWKKAVDHHRKWLEENFNLVEYKKHPHFPKWADNINFVLELWGARKSFKPSHSFMQMRERIYEFAKMHDPKTTLLYLPGFAENGIDSHAPSYEPSMQCGGPEEFKKLVDEAHELGYKVMAHTNVLAMTFTHPLYNEYKKYQVVDVFNRPQGWGMDMDGDWLTEPFFAYMNPGYKEWGDLMEKTLGKLINTYNLDAVFLDQTLLAFNVNSGPNFLTGMKEHVRRLQNAFPNTLFAGEGLHEQVLEVLPLAQIHGLDSLFEIHGAEGQANWRKAHPISVYLFSKYVKFTAHLLTRHPANPLFETQDKAYTLLNVVPALCLYNSKQKMDIPQVRKLVRKAKRLNQKGSAK